MGEETAASVTEGSSGGPKAKAAPAVPGKNVPAVKVDTVGYPTTWRKIAIFNVEPKNAAVKDAASGAVVHPIGAVAIKNLGKDEASQDAVWQVDFTAFTRPGKYILEGGGAKSDPFQIGDGIYATALKAGLKQFYFQRCRTPLNEPHATWEGTSYTRKGTCHAHEDVGWDFRDYPNKKRRFVLEAGWHDAGNYEMYIPSTGPSAQAMLMAFEANPEVFPDKHFDIPESGNGVPDVLDEVKWGLRWILTMQEKTGAFRMRDALYKWGKHGAPEEDKEPRWVSGVGSAATAKAVSVLAMAARIYKKHDAPFAERCDKAARAGWAWLVSHPDRVIVDPKGSPQPLWDDGPDAKSDVPARFIAAVEVWRSFRVPAALDSAKKLIDHDLMKPEEFVKGAWVNISRWGVAGLALDAETPADLRQKARGKILEAAKALRERVEQKDGYRCMSRPDEYLWGHNSNLMERAHLLLVAQKLDPAQEGLLEAVRDQWHWVLGRNPNGYSMVTRVGKGPEALYHLEWHKAKPLPPGYLVGGPNAQQMRILSPDAPAKALLWDNPEPLSGSGAPAHQLWHSEQSDLWDGGWLPKDDWSNGWWAVTEPDIYYNANFVLVAAAMQK